MIDKIKIGWKEYGIVETEPIEILVGTDEIRCGEIDYNNQIININKDLNVDNKKATLIHEVLHAIDDMYGVGLTENAVEALGNGIYTVLKDNNLKIVKE